MRKLRNCIAVGLILSLVAVAIGCGDTATPIPEVTGSGKFETKEMDYSDFSGIETGHAFEAEIIKANSFFVSITLDDNLFEYLDIAKTGDTLHIRLKPNFNYRETTKRATITLPDLRILELTGASRADVSGFSSTDSLQLEASGASFLTIENLEAGNTRFNISGASTVSGSIVIADGDFDVSGASTVELEGTAHDVSMDISGASSARMDDFAVSNADIELSGASNATVNVNGRLDVIASGASHLKYIGTPTLGEIDRSGGSTVSQKENR